jgi:hypothetical protein
MLDTITEPEEKLESAKAKEEWDKATHSLADWLKIFMAEDDGEFMHEDLVHLQSLLDERDRRLEIYMRSVAAL